MGTLFTGLGAAAALADTDIIPVHQGGARAVGLTGAQLLTYVGTTYVPLAGNATMTGALTIASGTLTASAPALNITQTWTTGAAFTGALMNITDTSSTVGSLLQDWQVGGVSKASIAKDGTLTVGSNAIVTGAGYFSALVFGSSFDLYLFSTASGCIEQRNGITAQSYKLFGTYIDGANYQYLQLSANGTTGVTISAVGLGTPGANQDITLTPGGSGSVKFPSSTGVNSTGYLTISGVLAGGQSSVNHSAIGFRTRSDGELAWTSGAIFDAPDTALFRNAAGVVEVTNGTAGTWRDLKLRNLIQTEYHEMTEMTAPAAGAANTARIFAVDNGSGKTKLMVQFATGAAQQLAIEP